MPKFDANISMMFNEVDFLDRFELAAKAGFSGVEFLSPYEYEVDEILDRLQQNNLSQVLHNLPVGNFSAGERGIACLPDRIDEFKSSVDQTVKYATKLGAPQVNCLSGIKPENVSDDLAEETLINNLKYAAPILQEAGVKLIVESINTIDMPGFFLTNTSQALSLIEKVDHPNLFIQYDIYHMQIMEGDLSRTIENNLAMISHMQLADNPGRHEPGTGEINYNYLLSFIDEIGYDGWIGCEYIPLKNTLEGLDWMKNFK
tara:strand:- start:1828 stop:2604 length:777 start_codon:yes stop_codon:yes gene_type:complete